MASAAEQLAANFNFGAFKKATELFKDPDFDGEPAVIYTPGPNDPPEPPDPDYPDGDPDGGVEEEPGVYKVRVSGVDVKILAKRVEYLGPDGELITESYKDYSRKQIRSEYASLDDFLNNWNKAKKKAAILDELEERGITMANLAEEVGKDYGDFDLICHIAYDMPPLTRKERANNVKKRNYFTKYGDAARAVLESLLEKYADEGITTIESPRVLKLRPFDRMGTPIEIINNAFGGKTQYEKAIRDLENELYQQDESA